MSIEIVSGVIVALIVISLVVSSISYNRQRAIAQRNKLLAKIKANTLDYVACIELLLQVDKDYDLLILFQKQLMKLLLNAQEIAPQDKATAMELIKEQANLKMFQAGQRKNKINLIETSDESLTSTKMQLGRVAKQLDIFRNKGFVSPDGCDQLKGHIKRIQIEVEVESHKAQAHQYALDNELALHLNHLQQARDALTKSSLDFDQKNEQIKELTDWINQVKKTNKVVQIKPEQAELSSENSSEISPEGSSVSASASASASAPDSARPAPATDQAAPTQSESQPTQATEHPR